jgi:predicted TIM-barrel fold metal-dependent hydrolase
MLNWLFDRNEADLIERSKRSQRFLMTKTIFRTASRLLVFAWVASLVLSGTYGRAQSQPELNDVHFHLTNYIQQGTDIHEFLRIMGTKVGRVAVLGIPLQQEWSYENSGDYAPTYYLQTDAPLYYYSFTDAYIAMAYRSLTAQEQARFDPMITGFNPADMYAADHIRRVLKTFPGVFSGIGEFTIHKEFVSAKVAGETASLQNPALDRILDFAAEAGLVVLIHNDMDVPFAKEGSPPAYLAQMKAVLKRHPKTTIIWAHTGMGRIVRPIRGHAATIEAILQDPAFSHVNFDISWDEVAKYLVAPPESTRIAADLLSRHPDRFLFGTDEVAPSTQEQYLRVYYQYDPLWRLLTPAAREKITRGNYERIFDEARQKVRTWEDANAK